MNEENRMVARYPDPESDLVPSLDDLEEANENAINRELNKGREFKDSTMDSLIDVLYVSSDNARKFARALFMNDSEALKPFIADWSERFMEHASAEANQVHEVAEVAALGVRQAD